METWKHKDIEITLNHNGRFVATMPNGQIERKPSLDAMKVAINNALLNAFVPFDAYIVSDDKPMRVKVIDVALRKTRWSDGTRTFTVDPVTKQGTYFNRDHSFVYEFTPGMKQLLLAEIKREAELTNERNRLDDEIRHTFKKIPAIMASTFTNK